jgi:hypothetical protein
MASKFASENAQWMTRSINSIGGSGLPHRARVQFMACTEEQG